MAPRWNRIYFFVLFSVLLCLCSLLQSTVSLYLNRVSLSLSLTGVYCFDSMNHRGGCCCCCWAACCCAAWFCSAKRCEARCMWLAYLSQHVLMHFTSFASSFRVRNEFTHVSKQRSVSPLYMRCVSRKCMSSSAATNDAWSCGDAFCRNESMLQLMKIKDEDTKTENLIGHG
jgi:hypothetical protein